MECVVCGRSLKPDGCVLTTTTRLPYSNRNIRDFLDEYSVLLSKCGKDTWLCFDCWTLVARCDELQNTVENFIGSLRSSHQRKQLRGTETLPEVKIEFEEVVCKPDHFLEPAASSIPSEDADQSMEESVTKLAADENDPLAEKEAKRKTRASKFQTEGSEISEKTPREKVKKVTRNRKLRKEVPVEVPESDEENEASVDTFSLPDSDSGEDSSGSDYTPEESRASDSKSGQFCPECKISVLGLDFAKHLKDAHPNSTKKKPVALQLLKCDQCSYANPNRRNLAFHKQYHHAEAKHPCGQCGRGFKRKRDLIAHEHKEHLKIPLVRCEDCGKEFNSTSGLRMHRMRHHSDQPVPTRFCAECGLEVAIDVFPVHMARHRHKDKTYPCPHCDKVFLTGAYVRVHVAKVHGIGQVKLKSRDIPKQCTECGVQMKGDEFFRAHMFTEHGIELPGLRRLDCEYCDRVFYKKRSYDFHVMEHTGEKPYKCDLCGYCARRPGNIWSHKKFKHKIISGQKKAEAKSENDPSSATDTAVAIGDDADKSQ
ncbi:unnamed protein product [Notodromas monacha]|uniref:C2H2-type domain-containing protein n=1 Tax=Notodromas monacha TaxID=399045 RepID=A0A7R9GD74_9CRUS|nr:unnamed protein product [Notodromas monacha]CAG0918249.1 unnamed protein product [Notodromas monacha]